MKADPGVYGLWQSGMKGILSCGHERRLQTEEKVQGFPGLGDRTQLRREKKSRGWDVEVQRALKPRHKSKDFGFTLT